MFTRNQKPDHTAFLALMFREVQNTLDQMFLAF